jgi:hypothetical protein
MCLIENAKPRILATTDSLGSVTLCDCGTVSLHLGGVSVRLELADFAQAAAMCQAAMHSIRQTPSLQSELTATLH